MPSIKNRLARLERRPDLHCEALDRERWDKIIAMTNRLREAALDDPDVVDLWREAVMLEESDPHEAERLRKAALGPAGWLNANLRTTFEKIIRRAGLQPWPKLFQNLRASRETELVESYPVQVVTSWLGNTPNIAMRHYLMTTDAHFQAALKGTTEAAQNPAQQAHARERTNPQAAMAAHEKTPELPGFADSCDCVQLPGMAGTGFEPATSRL